MCVCTSLLPHICSSFLVTFSSENSHSLCRVLCRHFLLLPRVAKQWLYNLSLANWTLDCMAMMKGMAGAPLQWQYPGEMIRRFLLQRPCTWFLSVPSWILWLPFPSLGTSNFSSRFTFLLLSSSVLVSVACNQNKS